MALDVHLVTPEREVWAGPAEMVIAHGTDGMVGILAGHAPLLIRLSIAPIRIQLEEGRWVTAVVDGGFLHVTSGDEGTRVDVLADGGELEAEVDRDAARALAERLAQQLSTSEGQEELEAQLARAKMRAELAAR